METKEALKALDTAIEDFAEANGDEGAMVIGWVLSASVVHPSMPRSNGYFQVHSEGLPYHSQLGLFHQALEEMKISVMSHHLKGENE